MNYVVWPNATDYRLRMASYNDSALSLNAGLDVALRRGWLLSLLFGHEQARNATDANSIGLRLSYGAQPAGGATTVEMQADAMPAATTCPGPHCKANNAAH